MEILIYQNRLHALWKKLEKQNIATLPDASVLKKPSGKEYELYIHDAMMYQFELITKNEKRTFAYECPKMYSNKFKKAKEFKQVVRIIELIKKLCKLKIYIC